MSEIKISAKGERAAIGGYLPQFDEFARLVYANLINKKLEWIRVADPEAEKLDDIQFSNHTEVHAYQVKWTISDALISYSNFTKQLPNLISSWKKIKANNPGKKVIPHLITNKELSVNDSIKKDKKTIGNFNDFMIEVWGKLKKGQQIDKKWAPILEDLKNNTKLEKIEFVEFIECFDFQASYKQKSFSVTNSKHSKEEDDLQDICRLILEKVADKKREIEFTAQQIINELSWNDRFKTNFNHDLIIDLQKYQPIKSTIDKLDLLISKKKEGYIFLIGGPGSGKSTLLTQWSKSIKERIIKYYAFDFTNPSSHLNYHERGNSTFLFFDLVFQIKDAGIYRRDILPYKDLHYLRDVFFEQLNAISLEYKSTGRKTIIIIDGLDHIPREYKTTSGNFLKDLPSPISIPEGVIIILGSQSYDLEDLSIDIKKEFKKGDSTLIIDSLKTNEVFQYIDSIKIFPELSLPIKQKILEISQGHPLYLSYLIEKIRDADDRDSIVETFSQIDGDIENYYDKIWEPIQQNTELIRLLGLISRVNGSINPQFVTEWDFDVSILKKFKEGAKFLFNQTKEDWIFFHNSFRQFLLDKTATNLLTDEYDSRLDFKFHNELAEFYEKSKVEPTWKKNFHFFKSENFEAFIKDATPDNFTNQILNFRPIEDIRLEAKLGIDIALRRKDAELLVRYLFTLSEIERRLYNINPSRLIEEFLILGKVSVAKNYLRNNNTLLCSKTEAYEAAVLFKEFGYETEGLILFNLAYPEFIKETVIKIDNASHHENDIPILEEWIYTAPHFIDLDKLLLLVNNIFYTDETKLNTHQLDKINLRLRLLSNLSYCLINYNRLDDLKSVIAHFEITDKKTINHLFPILRSAVDHCVDHKNNIEAEIFLNIILSIFDKDSAKSNTKIYISDLIYKVRKDIDVSYQWIKDVSQPSTVQLKELGMDGTLEIFSPLLKYNKIFNLSGNNIPIHIAIPSAKKGSDEELLVEFERMLCLITQLLNDGILNNNCIDIIKKVSPIVKFYYKDISHRNNYNYKLGKIKEKYFDLLIHAVSTLGTESIIKLGDYFINEFEINTKHWTPSIQRSVLKYLFEKGYNSIDKIKTQLTKIESNMLINLDIDSRITECIEHANIWIDLSEYIIAENWIKKAFKESIGIGYRKDYQFNTWIDWLKIINSKDLENAPERIIWFLANLNHIKQTTEGRAFWSASEKLLKTTFSWNFSAGLSQLKWQIEESLIDFEESMAAFLEQYFENTTNGIEFKLGLQFYTEFFLLFSEEHQGNLLNQVLKKGYQTNKNEFLDQYLTTIIDSINITAISKNRYSYLSIIQEFCTSLKIIITDYYPNFKIHEKKFKDSTDNQTNTLIIKNYKNISEKEVLELVTDYESFKSLVINEDLGNSFFNWSKVIDKITPFITINQVKELSDITNIRRRQSDFYSKLSDAALKLGNRELATDLANKSLEMSSESGWLIHYDGGSRIKALQSLKNIDTTIAVNRAFEIFAYDIQSSNYPSGYIQDLDNILPLLTEPYKEELFWPEIYNYLKRLMTNGEPSNNLPEIKQIKNPLINDLIDYLFYLSDNIVRPIKEKSRIQIAIIINEGVEYAIKCLNGLDLTEEKNLDTLNEVLLYLYEMKSDKTIEFKEILFSMLNSKNYNFRSNASKILTESGVKFNPPKKLGLSPIYSLELEEYKYLKIEKNKNPNSEIDINNPKELLNPFKHLINILSEETGINKTNLLYKIYTVMKTLDNPEHWKFGYEKEIRSHLEEINLKYSFNRPRVIIAKKAIMHVAAELIDAGVLNPDIVDKYFKSFDSKTLFFKEISKPPFVQTTIESEYGGVRSNWIDRINETSRINDSLIKFKENQNIIGEYTHIKNLDWGSPEEIYMTQLTINNDNEDYYYPFGIIFQESIENYHNLRETGHHIIMIHDHRFEQFNVKSNWLAINPVLAKYLNWIPEPSKLFAWNDLNGNFMAKSIYWSDGNINMQPRKDSEVGEGWFVIISDEALAQIKSIEPNLYFQKKIKRSKYEDNELTEETILKTIILE